MGLYMATTQNVITIADKEIVEKIAKNKAVNEKAEELGLYVREVSLDDYAQSGVVIHASNPSFDHVYSGEVFEFEVPTSIENEELEAKALEILELSEDFNSLKGDYKMTKAGVRTIVIS